jgi:hypothetical protein
MDREALRQIGDKLREGGRTRVSHGCGAGKTLLVSRESGRVSAWCFRCNEGFGMGLNLSMQDNLLRVKQAQYVAADAEYEGSREKPGELNYDFESWPPVARQWLLRAGFWGKRVEQLGAGWSEELHRVVLPIRNMWRAEVSWTARAVDGRLPKYLTGYLPDDLVAECVGGTVESGPPIIVEDWLSCNKIALAGYHSICMLGTYPKAATLSRILQFSEVYVWLDNDLPPKYPKNNGQIMARKLARMLRAYGVKVNNIASDRDPKLLDSAGISRWIVRYAEKPTT